MRAFGRGDDDVAPWDSPTTGAPGIRIPAPFAGRLILRALGGSGGGAVVVTEAEISAARERLGVDHGIAVAAEAAAAWAGYLRLRGAGAFGRGETVVVYATGAPPA